MAGDETCTEHTYAVNDSAWITDKVWRTFHTNCVEIPPPPTPTRPRVGQNVLQKGYSTTGGGQYKIQVDKLAGRPSCTMVGQSTSTEG